MMHMEDELFDSLTPSHADPDTIKGYVDYKDGLIEVTVFYRPVGGGAKRRVDSLFAMSDMQDVGATDAVEHDFGAGTRSLIERGLL